MRDNLKAACSEYRMLKRFPRLEDDKHLSSFDADRILWAVAEVADRVAEGKVAPEDLVDEMSIPGVPESVQKRKDYDGWSAGAVRAGTERQEALADQTADIQRFLENFRVQEASLQNYLDLMTDLLLERNLGR